MLYKFECRYNIKKTIYNIPRVKVNHLFFLSGEMGPDFSPGMAVKSVTSQQMVRIHQLFRQAKFDDPSGDVSICFLLAVHWELLYYSFVSLEGLLKV